MEDEYDIYGDLEGFDQEAAQDNKVVQELKAQIVELQQQIAKNEHEKQDTISRNAILLENISSLLVTAKAELKRKDAVIADIRRERDNAAFRRRRPVQRHDKGTQTTLIRLIGREVQTEAKEEPPRIKKERETEWHRERKRVEEDHQRRERERIKVKERVPVRERLGERGLARQGMKYGPRCERRGRGRAHEEERERERQARRGPRTPEADRHPVRFRSPVRVKTEESSVPDSASDIELSRTFIPMNRKELDRYVKEIGREQNRSPMVVEDTEQNQIGKTLNEISGTDLWDTRPRKKSKTPKKHRKLVSKTPVKQKSPAIIQSDEIGTTACGSGSVLSPVKSEDIEQRMCALHGHPPLPEPPELIIPPPEPPIIEHVPELPLDDDAKLNDSRELKIIESSDELVTTQAGPVVEDEGNSSAETVIERSRMEEDEDLEEGEIITPAPSPVPQSKAKIAEAKRNAKIAKAVAQLAQETQHKVKKKLKHKRADQSPKVEPNPVEVDPPAKEPTPEQDVIKYRRNLNGAFELPQRRNTFSAGSVVDDKAKRKQRLSEPVASKVAKKQTEALQELFGSDDDNSFVVAPETVTVVDRAASGKRKRTESAGEVLDCKKSRKSEEDATMEGDLVEEKKSAGTDVVEEVAKKDDYYKDENMIDPVEQEVKNEEVPEEDNEELKSDSSTSVESKAATESELGCEELKSDSATSVESKNTTESESTASLNCAVQSDANEVASESEPAINGNDVPESEAEPAPNHDEDVREKKEIENLHYEEVATAQEPVNVEEDKLTPTTSEDTLNQSREVIVMSNKYREYRIEEDNETEITFVVTRKKKRKTKSKSRNASLNASGAN